MWPLSVLASPDKRAEERRKCRQERRVEKRKRHGGGGGTNGTDRNRNRDRDRDRTRAPTSTETLLPDDWVKERAGELFLDLLQQPPEGREPGDVGLPSGAGATGEQAEDLALPGDDDRAGVAPVGELGVPFAVGQHRDLERVLLDDPVLGVQALDGLEAIGAPEPRVGGSPVLHHHQALLAVDVEVRWVADLGGGHDAVRLEEAVRRVRVCGLVFWVGVHGLGELAGSVPPTCEGEGKEQEKKT